MRPMPSELLARRGGTLTRKSPSRSSLSRLGGLGLPFPSPDKLESSLALLRALLSGLRGKSNPSELFERTGGHFLARGTCCEFPRERFLCFIQSPASSPKLLGSWEALKSAFVALGLACLFLSSLSSAKLWLLLLSLDVNVSNSHFLLALTFASRSSSRPLSSNEPRGTERVEPPTISPIDGEE